MKRLAAFIATFIFVMFLYWLAGNEFERSGRMVLMVLISLLVSAFMATCPYIKD